MVCRRGFWFDVKAVKDLAISVICGIKRNSKRGDYLPQFKVLARSRSKFENQASVLLTFHHMRVSVSELDIAVVDGSGS